MGYGYSRRKVDKVHSQVRDDLRALPGITVLDTHALPKFVDLVVGWQGRSYLFEVKNTHKDKLTKDELEIKNNFTGHYDVITTFEEALKIMYADNPVR